MRNVRLSELLALEQQCSAVRLSTGIGVAIAPVSRGGMPAFAREGVGPDGKVEPDFADGNDAQHSLRPKYLDALARGIVGICVAVDLPRHRLPKRSR